MKLKDTTISQMNALGKQRIPFLFIIPYDSQQAIVQPLHSVDSSEIMYDFNGVSNVQIKKSLSDTVSLDLEFIPYDYNLYQGQLQAALKQLGLGNTYLLNLTTKTSIESDLELKEIFAISKAKYKLYYKDIFSCFSPEIFVQIKDNRIYSFPMKGTIDGTIEQAESILLNDPKETAEHYTIVDLIRNDLNLVAKGVRVDRFRYLDRIHTHKGEILQMSSQISGALEENWNQYIGDIFSKLLPAGSITGAPKARTISIINSIENYDRGFYTGVAGIYDGTTLDSGVLIRFIEKGSEGLCYKSGGGITIHSKIEDEYQELQHKIYIPK